MVLRDGSAKPISPDVAWIGGSHNPEVAVSKSCPCGERATCSDRRIEERWTLRLALVTEGCPFRASLFRSAEDFSAQSCCKGHLVARAARRYRRWYVDCVALDGTGAGHAYLPGAAFA